MLNALYYVILLIENKILQFINFHKCKLLESCQRHYINGEGANIKLRVRLYKNSKVIYYNSSYLVVKNFVKNTHTSVKYIEGITEIVKIIS